MNRTLAASAATVPLAVLVHPPITLYFANQTEFAGSAFEVLGPFLVAFFVATGLLWVVLGCLGPARRASARWWLLVVAILAAVQSSFLAQDLGLLTGARLEAGTPRGAILDITVIGGVFVLLMAARARLSEHVGFATAALLAWLGGSSLLLAASSAKAEASLLSYDDRFAALTTASASTNVFHVMFDSFQADTFASMAEAEPALATRLDGFTFFEDQAAYGQWTTLNFTPMWAGEGFFDRPLDGPNGDRRMRELVKASHPRVLAERGIHVALVTPDRQLCTDGAASCLTALESVAWRLRTQPSGPLSMSADSLFVGDLALYRLAPSPLKPLVYGDGAWALSRLAAAGRGSHQEQLEMNVLERQIPSSVTFFRDYVRALRVESPRPAYHFIHVFPPHQPFVLDAECNPRLLTVQERRVQWRNRGRDAYEAQARCAWRLAEEFLDRLKAIGAYDRSAVILESDHGLGVLAGEATEPRELLMGMRMDRMRAFANPLLVVKPPFAKGALRRSRAPTTHFDSPATVLRWLGIDHPLARRPGFFEVPEGQRRGRTFFLSTSFQPTDTDGPIFHALRIEGPVREPGSWRSLGVFRDVGLPHSNPEALPLSGYDFAY